MADVIFRKATEADLHAIVALLAEDRLGATRENPADEQAYLAAFAVIDASSNETLLVADQQGRVVGCLQVSFLPGLSHGGAWRGQIEAVRVASDLRGSGLGRRMLAEAIARCRTKGCRIVQLTTNSARVDAARFYVSLGFKATHVGMKLEL